MSNVNTVESLDHGHLGDNVKWPLYYRKVVV